MTNTKDHIKDHIKQAVVQAIDEHKAEIIALGEDIFRNPELGFKEHRTAQVYQAVLERLGIAYQPGIAITGSKATLQGRAASPAATVGVMGELDAVVCPEHPHAHPETGAAHSCGHNAQMAALAGVAIGLVRSGAMAHLDGNVALLAVPAEEPVEIEWRQRLREQGKLAFLGGKQEFIRHGALDDVDMTVMFHSSPPREGKLARVGGSSNGFVAKLVRYRGKEAHAGGAPHNGINALNAAMMGLMGIHAQRETFRDDDHVRIHPIITKGGDLVNIIPADVRIETYVRAATMEAIVGASAKTNRALEAGAMAVGAAVEILEIPGFLPRVTNAELDKLMMANAVALLGEDKVAAGSHGTGSSDIGDVMHIMPAIHPYFGGFEGEGHTRNYVLTDPELAFVTPAKAMAMTVVDLLADGAAEAVRIREQCPPKMTKEQWLRFWEEFCAGGSA
jgi:amidohydrolase